MRQAAGLSVSAIGLAYSLGTVVDIAMFYPSGVLADRWGRKWSAVPSMTLYALGLALLPLANGFYSLVAVAVLLGFANGIGTGVVMIIGADLARMSLQQGQFLGPRLQCVRQPEGDGGSLLERHPRPGPGVKRGAGRRDGPVHVGRLGRWQPPDDLLAGRGDHFQQPAPGRGAPLAADEQLIELEHEVSCVTECEFSPDDVTHYSYTLYIVKA